LGLHNVTVNSFLQFVEIGPQGRITGRSGRGKTREARPQQARVDAGEEQGGPQALRGHAIALGVGQAFDQAVKAHAAELISDGALRDVLWIAAGDAADVCPDARPAGVAVWGSFALDPGMGALFFGTGNNYTNSPSPLSDSIVAVNARTGALLWSHQVTAHDVWAKAKPVGPDFDFGAGPQLFEATIDGQTRQLVGAGQKSGLYYAFDRHTGRIVWATQVGYGAAGGGIHAEAAIGPGKIYVWSNNAYQYGKPPEQFPANVDALDPATGDRLWADTIAQPAMTPAAGYLSNNVHFTGALAGWVRAVRAYRLLPETAAQLVGAGLPVAEIALGVLLLVGLGVRAAAVSRCCCSRRS